MIVSKVTTRSVLNFITLDDVKRQLNIIDDESQDLHIEMLRMTAMEVAEKATNRLLSMCSVTASVKGKSSFYLPWGEIEAITSITIDDVPISYSFNVITQKVTLTDRITGDTEVIVNYQAGYTDTEKVPNSIKMGSLIITSDLFENRESIVVGASVNEIPLTAKALFDTEKLDYV